MSSVLEFLLPWDVSPSAIVAWTLGLGLYLRGLRLTPRAERPHPARTASYLGGATLIYFVLQTRFEYLATHMFFLHALQQFVVHHLGPVLVALACPQAVLARAVSPTPGVAAVLRRLAAMPLLRAIYSVVQNSIIAPVIFVGLIVLWLLPEVHFVAMLSAPAYWWMNWSMLIDGLLFWFLVLDPRSRQEGALHGHGARMAMVMVMMVPEMLVGAYIGLATRDLYDVYDICGRVWAMSALEDQQLGGLILWIPVSLLDMAVFLVLMRWVLRASAASARAGAPRTVSVVAPLPAPPNEP